ncbi:MAG: RNA 3'-terminal phosphate cyclase [Candidatus Thorarchaeota archaeon]|jgi:RNA 3'-phosphate cyclase
MIEIDGSYGEGGGQILRTAVSLSALTMKPIRITNIRAGRPKPGLKRQHIAGIELTGLLVDATIKGLDIGSTTVEFVPNERRFGTFSYDVGTAGSISLVLQAVLPPAVLSSEPIVLNLRGGTDVKWSPPIDYMNNVFTHTIARMSPRISINQKRRGHYPRGGGMVSCEVIPTSEVKPLDLVKFGELVKVSGISHCVRLPGHIAEGQAVSAEDLIRKSFGIESDIIRESYSKGDDPHLGPGTGIVIWAEDEHGTRLGSDMLGERGKSAESVGSSAASHLVSEVSSEMAIDSHLCDMLIPYLAIASGESRIGVTEITSHLTTNIWAIEHILGMQLNLQGESNKSGVLTIEGAGLSICE